VIGRRHTRTLMKKMGIHALYRKPHTSRSHPAYPVYPYLLRSLEIERPNHVWAADITYIPMRRGFIYLVFGNGLGNKACSLLASVKQFKHGFLY